MKPRFFTLILHWISANSQHGFAARSDFVFLTTQFQICRSNTVVLKHTLLSSLCCIALHFGRLHLWDFLQQRTRRALSSHSCLSCLLQYQTPFSQIEWLCRKVDFELFSFSMKQTSDTVPLFSQGDVDCSLPWVPP